MIPIPCGQDRSVANSRQKKDRNQEWKHGPLKRRLVMNLRGLFEFNSKLKVLHFTLDKPWHNVVSTRREFGQEGGTLFI